MKLLATLLTTLFVAFMPLGTAYAEDGPVCENTSLVDFLKETDAVNAAGGLVVVLSDKQKIENFATRFAEKAGIPIPGEYDTIVISVYEAGFPIAGITLFKDGCSTLQGKAPTAGLPYLLQDTAPNPADDPALGRGKI